MKDNIKEVDKESIKVSNPWREAIEDKTVIFFIFGRSVSNPWREAIEVPKEHRVDALCISFQSLEGGY